MRIDYRAANQAITPSQTLYMFYASTLGQWYVIRHLFEFLDNDVVF